MFTELRRIERLVNLVIGKPLSWVIYGIWLIIVGLAVAVVWLHNHLLRRRHVLTEKP